MGLRGLHVVLLESIERIHTSTSFFVRIVLDIKPLHNSVHKKQLLQGGLEGHTVKVFLVSNPLASSNAMYFCNASSDGVANLL